MRVLAMFSGAFSAAIFTACYLLTSRTSILLGAATGVLCLLFYRCIRSEADPVRRCRIVLTGLCIGFLWYGLWTMAWVDPVRELDGHSQMLTGEVMATPRESGNRYVVTVRMTNSQPNHAKVLLYGDESAAELRPGDRIAVVSEFSSAEWDLAGEEIRYLNAQGILLRAEASGPLGVERPGRLPVRYWPAAWAETLKTAIRTCFSGSSAPLVRALVTGDRNLLDRGFRTDLQRTGLAHTVAVSGMHLAVLASVLELVLGRGRRRTALLLSLAVFVFCGLVGNTPSVIRAAVMILMLQIAPLLGRERDDPTALGLSLMLLLAWNPLSAGHIGLQMSFAAVAGILLITEKLSGALLHRLKLDKKVEHEFAWRLLGIPRFLVDVLTTTLGASLLTVPLTAIHFGTVSLIAPVSNLAALWAVSLLFLVGLTGGTLGIFLPGAGAVIGRLADPLVLYLDRIVGILTRPRYAAVPTDLPFLKLWIFLVYGFIIVWFILLRRRKIWIPAGIAAAVLSFCLILLGASRSFDEGPVCTTVFDVGQGQCVAIRSGDHLMMVDCGGSGRMNAGEMASDYLQARGHETLDLLVLTHFHADHSNGAVRLMRRMRVKKIAAPDVDPENPLRKEIEACAAEVGTEVCYIREDTLFPIGTNGRVHLVAPLGRGSDVNENCVTVIATTGNYDILITGDMNSDTEYHLMRHEELPDVELMLAGHHGAATSNSADLLSAVRPETVAVSAGFENKYGHPAPEALNRFERFGAQVLRTDLQGTLSIRP